MIHDRDKFRRLDWECPHCGFPVSLDLIDSDFAEAMRCRYANAPKGCVALCRRALQNAAKNKGVQSRDIGDQIKEMRSTGLITDALFNAAQEIRQFGAFGAHPQDDELDDVTLAIADSVLELTNRFMEHLFVMPARTAELAKRRQSAKQTNGKNSGI
jgi:hypothetical protein